MFTVNGLGATGVLPPFALGLGTPLGGAYGGGGIPSLGAFALATTGALGSANPAALRGFSNVLLVSNLNEEVNVSLSFYVYFKLLLYFHLIFGFVFFVSMTKQLFYFPSNLFYNLNPFVALENLITLNV